MTLRDIRPIRFLLSYAVAIVLFAGLGFGADTHAFTTKSQTPMLGIQGSCLVGCAVLPETSAVDPEYDRQPQPDKIIPAYVRFQRFHIPHKIRPNPGYQVSVARPPDLMVLSRLRI